MREEGRPQGLVLSGSVLETVSIPLRFSIAALRAGSQADARDPASAAAGIQVAPFCQAHDSSTNKLLARKRLCEPRAKGGLWRTGQNLT